MYVSYAVSTGNLYGRIPLPTQRIVSIDLNHYCRPYPTGPIPPQLMENPTEPTPSTSIETEQLSKIRTLLFGEQLQNQNQRFEQLEQQVQTTFTELRTQLSQQIDSLETRLTQQMTDLSQQLEKHAASQATELRNYTDTVVTTANETLQKTLQNDFQQHMQSLKSEITHQMGDTIDSLQAEITTQKSNDEAERVHLSNLFGEISQKLGSHHSATS